MTERWIAVRYRDGERVARVDRDGDLHVEGIEVEAADAPGYEWVLIVRVADVPRVVDALGGGEGDVLDAAARWCAWRGAEQLPPFLEAHGIPVEYWAWLTSA